MIKINEEIITRYIRIIIGMLGTLTSFLLGGWDAAIKALVALAILDYITGLTASHINGELSSDIGRKGAKKKALMFAAVAVAHLSDVGLIYASKMLVDFGIEISSSGLFRSVALVYYIGNEAVSNFENIERCGVPIPPFLRKGLKQVRDNDISQNT